MMKHFSPKDLEHGCLEFLFSRGTGDEVVRLWGHHLSNRVIILSYIRRTSMIAKHLPPRASVLDWGAGRGHMTYLLAKFGLSPTHYDVTKSGNTLSEELGLPEVIGDHPEKVQLPDESFDAVLSSGTLEHVNDIPSSIREIRRVLKPGGLFFIFNFPHRYSPSEFIARKFLGSTYHPILWSLPHLEKMLSLENFRILKSGYENAIPMNLSGPVAWMRPVYNLCPRFLLSIDALMTRMPGMNLMSNSVWAIGKK
ncbi:MAG: class I SAM-dependent methyltransferase [Deltaproteobacteria bacterium]|nr:class I SAM-dependent methyltransferase [Deltaproteobacteria bacterium]